MSHTFPDDLVQLQRDLDTTKAALKQFLDEHPHSPEPMDGWHRKVGEGSWYESRRDPSPGWSDEEKQTEVDLRARLLALIDKVHTHPHWDTLSGSDLVKARTKLKRVDDTDEQVTSTVSTP
ncbi:hypothetical protein [Streptomyces sp. N2A]|uniref:hypothetical protein n=1 Tax=Streptomyces sp. N2A TaxID=3073936 RepID=UPI0028707A4F|nr:hypothetical protein [Streptomyces sp. N2A]